MPELPEVEIVKQSLNYKIKQKKIKKVIIKNRNLRFKINIKFEELLKNKFVKKVTRYSKYIIINFSKDSFCLIHLGMSGTIHLVNKKKKMILQIQVFIATHDYQKNIITLKFILKILRLFTMTQEDLVFLYILKVNRNF